ncbi:MAG: snare associated Golgi protein-domain-containing protein [Benjaminiella poitrasii]|nr:MAG: snare associated Golgi protein-domain-containing protein [Benjaminiella poitrasii]
MSSLIFMSAFPPIFGYSTYQTLSGYTYGFQIGFPISYLSGLLGAIVCFSLCRFFIKARVSRLLSNYSNLEAVVKAVEKKGFKLFLLIRISPYPFNLLNFFFASTSIPFSHFAVGTAISLLKIAVHVYIGANLTSFVEHLLGDDSNLTEEQLRAIKVKYVAFVVFSMIAMVVMAYLYRIAKAATAEANGSSPDDIVDEEQMSFLNHEEDEINASTITILSSETTTASPVFATHDEPAISVSSISSWDAWDNDSSVKRMM